MANRAGAHQPASRNEGTGGGEEIATKECITVPVGPPGRPHKSQVVKANGFLFFSAQRGVDPATYRVVSPDTAAQSRQLLENLKAVLGALGGSLDNVVKTGIYFKDLADRTSTSALWSEYFGHATRPARFTVQVADIFGPDNPSNILVDTVALAPGSPPKEILLSPYGQRHGELGSFVVKANGFLFFPAQRGVDPATNRVRVPDGAGQARQILEYMKAVLESLGGSLDDLVKTGLFLKDMGDRPAINQVWSEYFGHECPPTRFAVQMVEVFGPDDPSRILVDAIALAPGVPGRKECLRMSLAPRFGPLASQAVKAQRLPVPRRAAGSGPGHQQGAGPDTAGQTRQILENIKAVLESLGGSLDDVVKTGLYLKNFEDRPAINEVWSTYFGGTPPSRFAVQVAEIFGGADLSNILVDAIAIAPGAQTSTSP